LTWGGGVGGCAGGSTWKLVVGPWVFFAFLLGCCVVVGFVFWCRCVVWGLRLCVGWCLMVRVSRFCGGWWGMWVFFRLGRLVGGLVLRLGVRVNKRARRKARGP